MTETNIYGDVSGWYIFDQLDRYAHKDAIKYIWDCVTANANIHYFNKQTKKNLSIVVESWHYEWNKCYINVNMVDWKDWKWKIIATASFLFIAKKNPSK